MWGILVQGVTAALAFFLPRLLLGLGIFALTDVTTGPMISQLGNVIFEKLGAVGSIGGVNIPSMLQYVGVYDVVTNILAAYTAAFAVRAARAGAAAAANASMGSAASSVNSTIGGGGS